MCAKETTNGKRSKFDSMPSAKEMDRLLATLEKQKFDMKRLDAMSDAATAKAELAAKLRAIDPNMPDTDKLAEHLALYRQEAAKKKTWLSKGADILKAPFKWTWNFIKKHPILTAAVLATAAVAGGAYMAGGIEQLLQKAGMNTLFGAEGAARASEPLGRLMKNIPGWERPIEM
jgi:hypothetical protein